MKSTRIINREKLLTSFMIVSLLCFTFCVFGPIEMYIKNSHIFWFSYGLVIRNAITLFSITASVLTIALCLLPVNIFEYACSILVGLGMATYIQGNYLPFDYSQLDGRSIEWSNYSGLALINSAIWITIIVVPVLFINVKKALAPKVLKNLSVFVLFIQIATLIIMTIMSSPLKQSAVVNTTSKDMFTLSANKNVIVFVLDAFDAAYMTEILETFPEYSELFVDFTYYNNTLGMYPTTKTAIPYLLTGEAYLNTETFDEYLDHAYQTSVLYETLRDEKYSIGLYTLPNLISETMIDLTVNLTDDSPVVSSYFELSKLMSRFTAIKYAPQITKQYFWMYSGDFDKLKSANPMQHTPYVFDDVSYMETLKDDKLQISSQLNAFRVYHLHGSHPPYIYDETVTYLEVGEEGNAISQSRGALFIVLEYIEQLKNHSIYDNTMIVVIADHGAYNQRQNPLLMIKLWDEKKPFSVSRVPVSVGDIIPTICNVITNSYIQTLDVRVLDESYRERMYLHYDWDNSWTNMYLPTLYEFIWKGDASKNAGYYTGNAYQSPTWAGYADYAIGDVASFTENGTGGNYIQYGISDNGFWSIDHVSAIALRLTDIPNFDLEFYLYYSVFPEADQNQRIVLYANNVLINTQQQIRNNSMKFLIPNSVINSNELILRFEFPDAVSAGDVYSNSDSRMFAIRFESFILEFTKKITISIASPSLSIDFSERGNSYIFTLEGWYAQEATGRWSSELSTLEFFSDHDEDILLSIYGNSFPYSGETEVIINGHLVQTIQLVRDSYVDIVVPASVLETNGRQIIEIATPDAISPEQAYANTDTRALGVFITSIDMQRIIDD